MERPIFIVGTMRSGTTLLALILDSHPNICIGRESGFMRSVQYLYKIPDWGHGEDWYTRYNLTLEQFNQHIRGFFDTIFSEYARSQSKRRWGEKTPFHRRHVYELSEIFPDSQFIHIVRDVRAVCASLKGGKNKVKDAVTQWVEDNLYVHKFGKSVGASRYYLVRYEDIVYSPEKTLKALLQYLDEPWSENVLHHHEIESKKYSNDEIEGGKENRADRPIDTDSVEKWKVILNWWDLIVIKRIAAQTIRQFGYNL